MVPEGWEMKTVGQLFDVQLGKMLSKIAKEKYPQYKYLGNRNVRWVGFKTENLNEMYFSDREKEKFALLHGDILMCEGGEVGRCSIWNDSYENVYYQKALHRLRGKGSISPYYFQQYMQLVSGSKLLEDFTSRTSIAHLTREKLLELPVKCPPLPEQRKIAKILQTWDRAIATTEKLIDASKQQKKALMQQLLTGKKRFAGFEGEWERYALRDIVSVSSKNYDPKSGSENFTCIELEHLPQGGGKLLGSASSQELASAKSRFSSGDVLFGKLRPYLRKFYMPKFDGVCSTEIWVLQGNSKIVNSYLYYFVQTEMFLNEANKSTGSRMPRADWNSVSEMIVRLPTIEEQIKISKILSILDIEIDSLIGQLANLKHEKKALMQQLLTGKRRVKVDNQIKTQ